MKQNNRAKPNTAMTKQLRSLFKEDDVSKVYNTWLALLDSDNEMTRLSAIKWFADKFIISAEKDLEVETEVLAITSADEAATLRKALIEKLRAE